MSNIIITGGASGIGKACLEQLNERFSGVYFYVIDNNTDLLDRLSLNNSSNKLIPVYLDVSNYKAVASYLNKEGFGPDGHRNVRALIQSAGYIEPYNIGETPMDEWLRTMDVNINAAFFLMRYLEPNLAKSKGKVINIASTSASSPRPGWTAYAASKAALLSLSISASEEWKEKGIKVYSVSPGRCATPLRKRQAPNEDPNSIMQPETVGKFVLRLVGPEGDHLDGQDLIIRK